jgi:hypothetical protein
MSVMVSYVFFSGVRQMKLGSAAIGCSAGSEKYLVLPRCFYGSNDIAAVADFVDPAFEFHFGKQCKQCLAIRFSGL